MQKGYRSGEVTECKVCGSSMYSYPSRKRVFCSWDCRVIGYSGQGNPKWRGGRSIDKSGYVYLYTPHHPYANKDGNVFEHRLVMEKILGRFLDPKENPHHINGVKDDNRPENLILMSSQSEPSRLHANIRRIKKVMMSCYCSV